MISTLEESEGYLELHWGRGVLGVHYWPKLIGRYKIKSYKNISTKSFKTSVFYEGI